MNEDDLLNEQLDRGLPGGRTSLQPPPTEAAPAIFTHPPMGYVQWSREPNDIFRPSGPRCNVLESGVYQIGCDDRGISFEKLRIVADDLIELDDTINRRVLEGMKTFWRRKEEYTRRKIIYKRGILLWGPAGSGKTATLQLLMRELLSHDGLVIVCRNPAVTSSGISALRRIEPNRNIIVVMEDIDEIVQQHGEHQLLALLDGENQVDNVVNVASTNYPERLGSRIVNRPSRFDERIFVDMPNPIARYRYLLHATKTETVTAEQLQEWVDRTEGFSVAHLRELVVAVFCLGQPFEDVLLRLSKMQFQIKPREEFKRENSGFEPVKSAKEYIFTQTGSWTGNSK